MGCFSSMAESYYHESGSCKRTLWITLGSILFVCLLIIGFTLLGVSVNKKVENNQYGLAYYERSTMKFGDIKEQGIYAIPPGATMLRFPRTFQDVDLGTIKCFSKDKILLELAVKVQYQLIKEDIIPVILKQYGSNAAFRDILKYIVESEIMIVCGQYTGAQYYENRTDIDSAMSDRLKDAVNNNSSGATIGFFQLINIQFPQAFSDVITDKQIAIQQATTALNARQSQLITANTSLLQAQRQASITIATANNNAQIILQQANATSQTVFNQWNQRGLAWKSIKDSLGLDQQGFIDFLKNEVLRLVSSPVVSL